ncbi:MAG: lytic transglycosylase domain-containing protein [Elusimicrobia bacterium]|nr:lytic transglycosylase domain-containing protein [Elusimicrobiota bacterium]
MRPAAILTCAWFLLGSSAAVQAQAPAAIQDVSAKRETLLKSISKWKVLVPEAKDNEVRKAFLPELERIEAEARKPEANIPELEKEFVLWKNFFFLEMQSVEGFKDSKAFIEIETERMRALLAVRQLETKAGAEGVQRVSFWKARISEVKDALTLRQLYDNMRVVENLVRPESSRNQSEYRTGSVAYTGPASAIRPEQAAPPPYPRTDGFSAGTFATVKDYLLARGAAPGVVGQTVQLVWDEVKRYAMDPTLVLALILQESGYNPKAQSGVGAKGLMQIMPSTGQGLGLRGSDFYDPVKNVKAGIRYLAEMLSRFNGDVKKALAAYNAGPGAVEKYNGVPPYKETKGYVKTVYATYLQLYSLVFN